MNHPRVTLSTGITVANFSSPHPFRFEDGSILEAMPRSAAEELSLEDISSEVDRGRWIDCHRRWTIPPAVCDVLDALEADPDVDIIILPLLVLTTLAERAQGYAGKGRTVVLVDRVSRICSVDRFGVAP